MGKKAVKLYFYFILIIISFLLLGLSILSLKSCSIDPNSDYLAYFLGLLLPVILGANFIIFLIFLFKLKIWILIPIISFIINYDYLTSIVQIRFNKIQIDNNSNRIKIATYNVHYFSYDTDFTVYQIANFLTDKKVDIVCFQEYIGSDEHQDDKISDALKDYPYFAIYNGANDSTRLAIFSKYPISSSNKISFPKSNNGSMWADISLNNGFKFRVVNNHLQTTGLTNSRNNGYIAMYNALKENSLLRAKQVVKIREIIDSTRTPLVVLGDLNDTPSSFSYKMIRGSLVDGFKNCGTGLSSTFRWYKSLLRIDYIFYSKEFKGIVQESPELDLSDHNPVIIELEYQN